MTINVDQLYRTYGPMVFRRCRKLLSSDAEAEDAMQDTFVAILRQEERLMADAPSSLLYQTATNVCLNRIRTRRRHPENSDEILLNQVVSLCDEEERQQAKSILQRLFGRESTSTLTLAVLHFYDGWTLEDVARETRMSVSGVRKRLRGLKERLDALQRG